MNKVELTYSPYTIKLSKPFLTYKGLIKERHGFILRLSDQTGNSGIGDVAPFPEFGSESLHESIRKLENIKLDIKIDLDNIEKSIDLLLRQFESLPSLRHGLEQALLNLICKEKEITLNHLLGRNSLKIININAIIGLMSPKESASAAEKFLGEGYSCIKLKIGRQSFKDDLECIEEIKQCIDDKLKIRLDVNGKWNSHEAIENINALEPYKIEYLEQPVNKLEDFIQLKAISRIPIAADESIRSIKDADNFIDNNAAGILILKPMMIGGLIPTLRIIDKALEKGIKTVISSSFESVIGRSFAVFAASLVHENIAHGLSTAGHFKEDLYKDPYPVRDGKIFL